MKIVLVVFDQVLRYLYLPVASDNLQTSLWTVYIGMLYKEIVSMTAVDSEVGALSQSKGLVTKALKKAEFISLYRNHSD